MKLALPCYRNWSLGNAKGAKRLREEVRFTRSDAKTLGLMASNQK